jgi:hypothetical protein
LASRVVLAGQLSARCRSVELRGCGDGLCAGVFEVASSANSGLDESFLPRELLLGCDPVCSRTRDGRVRLQLARRKRWVFDHGEQRASLDVIPFFDRNESNAARDGRAQRRVELRRRRDDTDDLDNLVNGRGCRGPARHDGGRVIFFRRRLVGMTSE